MPAQAAPSQPVPAREAGGLRQSSSEADVPLTIWASKIRTVHAHGPLAQQHEVHPPQHHNPHAAVNYARAAHEEMDEVQRHPPHPHVFPPGGHTGVAAYDKASTPRWLMEAGEYWQ